MADMGLPLAYGAGTAADTLESILKERLLRQEYERRLAEDAAQAEYQSRMAGVSEGRLGLDTQRLGAELPGIQADATVKSQTVPQRIKRADQEVTIGDQTIEDNAIGLGQKRRREGILKANPLFETVEAAPKAWQPFFPMTPDLGGKSPFALQGEQSRKNIWAAAAANQANADPYVETWTDKTQDEKGLPITVRYGRKRDGTIEKIHESKGATTADITNRKAYTQEFSAKLTAFEEMLPYVSMYSTQDPTSKRLGNALVGWGRQVVAPGPIGKALDPQGSFFVNLQEGLAMTGARVLGSNSQLSDAERLAAKNSLFPKLDEPIEVQRAKIQFWKRVTGMEDEVAQAQVIREGLSGLFMGIAGPQTGGDRYEIVK